MISDYQTMTKNGFIMYYRFLPKPEMFGSYGGNPLRVLAKDPSYKVNDKYPFDSYLIQSIDGDIELGKHCPDFHYPEKEPANLTICLVDNPSNCMHDFIVSPLRVQLSESIQRYNNLFGKESRLSGMHEFDLKFLQKRDLKIELIKQLFVLELIRLLQLRNIDLKIDNQFFQMLLLNRLFSIALVVDKLLYADYPSQTTVSNKEPQMYDCVISYATAHGVARDDIDSLGYDRHNLQGALEFLLEKRSQGNWNNVTKEMFPILIAHAVRNTSAHKIHAVEVLYSKFKEILQSLMEAVFIIVGQIPEQKTQQK